DGKRAVVAGGTAAAAWKAELLSAAGASVDVYAEDFADEMTRLANQPPRGTIVIHPRGWLTGGFHGAAGAIRAGADHREGQGLAAPAPRAGWAVLCVRDAPLCAF